MSCKIPIKKRKICIGDLKNKINIQRRIKKSLSVDDPKLSLVFENIATNVWSAVQTVNGFESFDNAGINPLSQTTHKFYIRKARSFNVTSQNFILFKDQRYKILKVENLDEQDEFLLLYALKKGDDTKESNSV